MCSVCSLLPYKGRLLGSLPLCVLAAGRHPYASELRALLCRQRVEFHRFTDMELIATAAELSALRAKLPPTAHVALFPEDRTHPLRLTNSTDLPVRWAQRGPSAAFAGSARRGEWYAFQIGVWALAGPVSIEQATFSGDLPPSAWSCINLGGVDETGAEFHRSVHLAKGQLNALWFGVQIPIDAAAGSVMSGRVTLGFGAGMPPKAVDVKLTVSRDDPLHDHGDGDVWRMARLRWLDSTIGSDDSEVPKPYTNVQHSVAPDGSLALGILGRNLSIGSSGLPAAIVGGRSAAVLSAPMRLALKTANGEHSDLTHQAPGSGSPIVTAASNSKVSWSASSRSGSAAVVCNGSLWLDGFGEYVMSVSPAAPGKALALDDIQLRMELDAANSKTAMLSRSDHLQRTVLKTAPLLEQRRS